MSRIAARALLIDGMDIAADCAAVSAPTLAVTGEAGLDFVVPSDGANGYVRLIASAEAVTLARTGHLGSITRPVAFAELVVAFLSASYQRTREPVRCDLAQRLFSMMRPEVRP